MDENISFDFNQILFSFNIADVISIKPYGSGHINDTFLVEIPGNKYLLQRINHLIFKQVPELMSNIEKVTNEIRLKSPHLESLTLVPSNDGKTFVTDQDGNYWRVLNFIKNSTSYDRVTSPHLAFEAGRVTGEFHKLMHDFPANELFLTLPGFHNLTSRLKRFHDAVGIDVVSRAVTITELIEFVNDRSKELVLIDQLIDSGALPVRVVHNDPKINNILFDQQGKGLCMIDLDTLMPGCLLHDFGDAIRTTANSAEEDESDTSMIFLNIELFEAYVRGYVSETRQFLTKTEVENLALSARVLTFTIGLRFLTDYIEGDSYFKIAFPLHNLQRARAQFALVKSIEANDEILKQIIADNYF